MAKFITLPIGIQNTDGGQKEVDARFLPSAVEYYYPGFHNGTVVVMQCGHSFFTPLEISEFERLLFKNNPK